MKKYYEFIYTQWQIVHAANTEQAKALFGGKYTGMALAIKLDMLDNDLYQYALEISRKAFDF